MVINKILILGSNNNAALAIAQDLGGKYEIHAIGFKEDFNKVEYSKFLDFNKRVSKQTDIQGIKEEIVTYVNMHKIDFIIPTNDRFTILISEADIRSRLSKCVISTPAYGQLIKGMDKYSISLLVNKHSIKIPKTCIVEYNEFKKFPIYLKSRLSWKIQNNSFHSGSLKKIKTQGQLDDAVKAIDINDFYLQEEVKGAGWGLEILANGGELLNYFAHVRIRESNPKGGYSSVAMSIHPNPFYINKIKHVLKDLNWTGVAMFEFKGDFKSKNSFFIEMNCRFWGSLPLALHAGNRFPSLLVNSLNNVPVVQSIYKENLKAQWFQADIIHFFKILLLKDKKAYNLPPTFSIFKSVFFSRMKNYNKYNGDWKPDIMELTLGFLKKIL